MINEPPKLTLRDNFNRPTAEQIAAFRDVPTGFVCDAMGGQGALNSDVRALFATDPTRCHAVGPALVADNGPAEILATMGALHILQPGDIIVAAVHGHKNCSASGDQFCGMLKNKGAAGFVTDGEMRDVAGIFDTGLPVWCSGLSPNSPYSNGPGVVGFGAVVAGRTVNSGDLIVADENGVVVVPFDQIDRTIEALKVVKEAEDTLEAKVKQGFCAMQAVQDMLNDGNAVMVRDDKS